MHLLGEVKDLNAEYYRAALVVVPLRTGSGVKVKLVEAICHGRASVVTPAGAQGLGDLSPRPFEVADQAADFAERVTGILTDPVRREALESAAVEAGRAFDPAVAHTELMTILLGP